MFLPQGTYVISGELAVTTGGINIIGAGAAATKISVSTAYASGDVFLFSNVSYCSVRMLSIQAPAPRTGGAAVHESTANVIHVQDVEMKTSTSDA